MITFTEDQAAALVTDAGTLKRGRELAGPAKWAGLGRTDTAAWGECAGSGAKPYLTGIDLTEPAFKCSCPSRVFPCKHGAGLLLLLARQPALLPAGAPPAWLAEWLEKRQVKGEEQAEKAVAKTAKKAPAPNAADDSREAAEAVAAPNAAQQKREAQRYARMQAGALDLEAWLLDLLRAGLAELERKPASFWENQSARLVDNQLPGLAAVLRELAEFPTAGPGWTQRLLGRLGELYVLVRAFLNRDNLAPAARHDVWQQVGITPKKDDLLADPAALIVADTWFVLGQYTWPEERVMGRRSWLYGQHSGRTALVLEFAFGSQPFGTALVPQGKYAGELVFYPGLLPLRAAPLNLVFKGSAAEAIPPGQGIEELLDNYATALSRQPWLRQWPAALGPVLLTPQPEGPWLLHQATGAAEARALPLRLVDEEVAWQWLAFSGGQPLTLFGEWDGQVFTPFVSWGEDRNAAGNVIVQDNFFLVGASAGTPVGSLAMVAPKAAPAAAPTALPAPAAPTETPALSASEVPTWAPLLRLALLGTRQSAETPAAFPTMPATGSREQQLLLAAGALALVQKAGYVPPAATVAAPTAAPADALPVLGPLGTECLHRMLVGAVYLELLPDYLRQVAAAGRRAPEALLVPLLLHATRSVAARAYLGAVLGERGRWLAALNPEWVKLFTAASPAEPDPADLTTWETGLLTERLAWLRQAFARDADAARALLLAALTTEPAKVQEALLKVLADYLHPAAEPTLEALLKSRGQEVRRQAAALLVRLPGAALTERLWARAAPLITARRKLLGLGKAALEVTLPTAWDKTWLVDGIEEKNDQYTYLARTDKSAAAMGAGAARLANLLALLPVGRWLTHLQLSAEELLEAALASEWAVPLLPAWALSTLAHQDAEAATAFVKLWQAQGLRLQQLKIHLDVEALAALLPAATQQQLLVPKLVLQLDRSGDTWEPALAALEQTQVLPGPWPWALTEAALAVVARHTTHTAGWLPYERRRFGTFISQTLLEKLAPTDAPAAQQLLAAIAEPHEFYADQFRIFTDTLRFKADLAASLMEPV